MNKVRMSRGIDELDPARRAEQDISTASGTLSDTEGVVVVDERIKRMEEAQAARERAAREAAATTEVAADRAAGPVLQYTSNRNQSRLLLITSDHRVHEAQSEKRRHILELERMFAEVHVIALSFTRKPPEDTQRISNSVWIYSTAPTRWWRMPFVARKVAKKELAFGEGFRPDIVIADDPFEAGLSGYLIAQKFNRSFQVHVHDDFLTPTFSSRRKKNRWRTLIAHYVLKRVSCVRTFSSYMQKQIMEHYRLTAEQVEVLPVYYDLEAWRTAQPIVDLRTKYPSFKFILLHISTMNELSYTPAVIDGLFYILRQYSTIGLVIVGAGPERPALEARVKDYGLSAQIKFESPEEADILSYIKTAQVVIHTSEEATQDAVVLQAAASEVPLVCGAYGIASELFIDGSSVLLCPVDSPPCFGEKVNRLLNNNPLRKQLAMNARNETLERIEQDYGQYMEEYRMSIERCLATPSAS